MVEDKHTDRCIICDTPTNEIAHDGRRICMKCQFELKLAIPQDDEYEEYEPDVKTHDYVCQNCGLPTDNILLDGRHICNRCQTMLDLQEENKYKSSLNVEDNKGSNNKVEDYNYVCLNCGQPTNDTLPDGRPVCENCQTMMDDNHLPVEEELQHNLLAENEMLFTCSNCHEKVDSVTNNLCEKCQDPVERAKRDQNSEPLEPKDDDHEITTCSNCGKRFQQMKMLAGGVTTDRRDLCSACAAASETEKKQIKENAEEERKKNNPDDPHAGSSKKEKDNKPAQNKKDNAKPQQDKSNASKEKEKSGVGGKLATAAGTLNEVKEKGASQAAKDAVKKAAKDKIKKQAKKLAEEAVKKAAAKMGAKIGGKALLANPYVLAAIGIALVIIYLLIILAGIFSAIMMGTIERGGADSQNSLNQWNNPLFYMGDASKKISPGFLSYQGTNVWSSAIAGADGVNYLQSMPVTTRDLRKTSTGKHIANALIPSNPTSAAKNTKTYVQGTACQEIHLATKGNTKNPWADGAYIDYPGLEKTKFATKNYMSLPGPTYGAISYDEWIKAGKEPSIFPGGAFGAQTPEVEEYYMNMRWPYSDNGVDPVVGSKTTDYYKKKVLITNKRTGRTAIGIVAEWGPAANLGSPKGNRIAGMSADLMYYLAGSDVSNMGADKDEYTFGFLEDQSLPAGPFVIGNAPGGALVFNKSPFAPFPFQKQLAIQLYNNLSKDYPTLSARRRKTLAIGLGQIGTRYHWGGENPLTGLDCSGFTMYAWKAGGVSLAHYTGAQAASANKDLGVVSSNNLKNALPGDLLIDPGSHVAMFAGKINGVYYTVESGGTSSYPHGEGPYGPPHFPGQDGGPSMSAVNINIAANHYGSMHIYRYNAFDKP